MMRFCRGNPRGEGGGKASTKDEHYANGNGFGRVVFVGCS